MQLRENRATLYVYGAGVVLESIDRPTGLPYEWIGGDAIDARLLGWEAGHNDRIREHVKAHGPPAGSFKQWDKELFDLKGYFALRRQSEEPHRLSAGGPALKSPDGAFTIRPVKSTIVKPDSSREDRLGIAAVEPGAGRPVAEVFFDEGRSELVWGPNGSGFAVNPLPEVRPRPVHGPGSQEGLVAPVRVGR